MSRTTAYGFNSLFRTVNCLVHSSLRYPHKTLRFLLILRESFSPKLHARALRTRELSALAQSLEQLGIFPQPRPNKIGPFLADSCIVALNFEFCFTVSVMNPVKSKNGTENLPE